MNTAACLVYARSLQWVCYVARMYTESHKGQYSSRLPWQHLFVRSSSCAGYSRCVNVNETRNDRISLQIKAATSLIFAFLRRVAPYCVQIVRCFCIYVVNVCDVRCVFWFWQFFEAFRQSRRIKGGTNLSVSQCEVSVSFDRLRVVFVYRFFDNSS